MLVKTVSRINTLPYCLSSHQIIGQLFPTSGKRLCGKVQSLDKCTTDLLPEPAGHRSVGLTYDLGFDLSKGTGDGSVLTGQRLPLFWP